MSDHHMKRIADALEAILAKLTENDEPKVEATPTDPSTKSKKAADKSATAGA